MTRNSRRVVVSTIKATGSVILFSLLLAFSPLSSISASSIDEPNRVQYNSPLIGIIALCVLEALIIALLLLNLARRRQSRREADLFASLAEGEHQRLEDLVRNVPGIVWEMRGEPGTAAQGMDFVSGYIQNIVGYRAEEWLSAPDLWLTALHEDDREWMPREVARIFASGKGGVVQCRYRAKNGQVVWVEVHMSVTCNEAGEPVALRGVTMDITDRKLAEEALRESETRFRHMADTSPVLIWMADTEMLCTYFNQRILDFVGCSMKELLGEGWLSFLHEDDVQRCIDAYTAGYERREPFVLEYRLRRADGEFRWVYDTGAPRFAHNGEFLGYIGSAVDIHDRKQAEETVRNIAEGVSARTGEDFFRTLVQYLAGMLEADYTVVGELTAEGSSIRTLAIWSDGSIINNITYVLANTPCQDVMAGRPLSFPENVQSRFPQDHMLREMEVESYLGMPLKDSTDRTFGLIAVLCRKPIEDVETHQSLLQIFASRAAAEMERRQAEQSLLQTRSELAHINRVLTTGELAATIAHEVNQPLTAMVANANAARRWLSNGHAHLDQVRDAVADIVLDAHRASQVVGRIRSLLRKEPRRTESLPLGEVIEEVVAIVRDDLVEKKINLRVDLGSGIPDVEADRVEMQQVMLNLIVNAIEAMRGVDDRSRNLLVKTLRDESGSVLVEVQDCGVGIAAENLARIFDAFYTTRPEGMGMGLSICRTIIEAHGGRLWAESIRDQGATFRFVLPATNAA